jgi:catechol 2,3-dioxygenase-like lactoylglutathione lyase family enzyme
MLKSLQISSLYVLDQDKALDFYVGILGLEVNTDADLGFMRWLTLNVPGDPGRQILLEKPGAPSVDEKTAEQIREMVSKGATGGHLFFTTDDCRGIYEELKAKGVEITQELTEQPYGTDFGLRDPFGNHVRISQPKQAMASTEEIEKHFQNQPVG